MKNLDHFTLAYIEALLWSAPDNEGDPMSDTFTIENISKETLNQIVKDCKKFQKENSKDLGTHITGSANEAGHCFALSRNGHGSGFFDSDWFSKDVRDRLQKAAMKFGSFDIYIGDDKKIYYT